MRKRSVIEYFDRVAPRWDTDLILQKDRIQKILDYAGVVPGTRVLDVACGTGVLIPSYLERNVESITGVDISREMIRIARGKYPQKNVQFLCDDVESAPLGEYDVIMVYNALPHFPEPEELIKSLVGHMAIGATLTIAHPMSREETDRYFQETAADVSCSLISEHVLAAIMRKYLDVTVKISNDEMYLVTGVAL